MKNNQTAVNWFIRMLYSPVCNGFIQGKRQIPHDIIQQAKQMEKEQIIEFADEYADAVMGGCIKRAEQYYNETYGK